MRKTVKKFISILCVMAIVLSLSAVGAMAKPYDEKTLMSEDFTTKTTVTKGEKWGDLTLVSLVNSATVANNYLTLDAGSMLQFQADAALSGKYVFELDFMQETVGKANGFLNLCDAGGNELIKILSEGNCITANEPTTTGGYYKYTSKPITANKWHKLKLVVNTATQTYDLCFDDTTVETRKYSGTIQRMKLDTQGGVATNFDNINFYKLEYSPSVNEKELITEENFDYVSGYKSDAYFGNTTKFKVLSNYTASTISIENGTLKVAPTAETKLYTQADSVLDGTFSVEFKFMQPTVGKVDNLLVVSNAGSNIGAKIHLYDTWIRTNNRGLCQYSANKWYNIKVVMHTAERKYDVYVNGVKYENEAYFDGGATTKDYDMQRIYMHYSVGNATTYYDDFKVYREYDAVTKLAEEDFSKLSTMTANSTIMGGTLKVVSANNASVENGRLKLAAGADVRSNIFADVVDNTGYEDVSSYTVEFDYTLGEIKPVGMIYGAAGKVESGSIIDTVELKLSEGQFYYLTTDRVPKAFLKATKTGEAYRFKIHMNEKKQTYDVYVDGVCYGQNIPFIDTDVKKLTRIFKTDGKDAGVRYIDNLVIYNDKVKDALDEITVVEKTAQSSIELAETMNGHTVTWVSSNENIITNDGTVIAPVDNKAVTMTASITAEGRTFSKEFKVVVLAPIGLKVTNGEDTVTAQAYYPGILSTITTTPDIYVAIYDNSGLVDVAKGYKDGDYYKAILNKALLDKGTYTARGFLFESAKTLVPVVESVRIDFTVDETPTATYSINGTKLSFGGAGKIEDYENF